MSNRQVKEDLYTGKMQPNIYFSNKSFKNVLNLQAEVVSVTQQNP